MRLNRVRVEPFASVVPHLLLGMPWGAKISPKVRKSCMIRSIDHFYRSPANSWRLLCEYITTTCEYWLPRQSLSDPTGFPAPGDAQSRWNQPERPRRYISILQPQPPRPRILPQSSRVVPKGKTEKVVQAAKIDISSVGLSRPLGLIFQRL